MAHQVPWNLIILEEFIRIGGLTKEEEEIMRTRVAGWTITQQSMRLGMSTAKVNNLIKRCKIKYDNVQPYSAILPPRKFSAQETYMDSH